MADYNPWLKASQQHLAKLNQEASATPVVLVHQHQAALVAVQDLERQRVEGLIQHQVGEQLRLQQHQQW